MSRPIIDISSWQHPSGAAIEWASVAASGVAGVIVKVTQGVGYASPWFASDLAGATNAGLLVGAYHFAQPNVNAAADEAAWCNEHVAGLDLPLGLWLDLEVAALGGGYQTNVWATAWLEAMHVATRLTGVYMNQSFCEDTLPLADTWPLWQVTLEGQAQSHNPIIVQTAATGEIPGISGQVDHDELLSSRWVNPPTVGPPTVEDEPVTADDIAAITESVQTMLRTEFAGPGAELHDRIVQSCLEALGEYPAAKLELTAPPAAP